MFRIIQSNPSDILRMLFRMRMLLLATLVCVVLIAVFELELTLPLHQLAAIFLGFLVWATGSFWRLKQPWVATQLEVFLNLMIDAGLFTGLLYYAGGATNPFVSFYLVTIVIAAAALSKGFVWSTVTVCVLFYTGLMFFFVPLAPSAQGASAFSLHVFGMWLSFLLSALLCGIFIAGIATLARQNREDLAEAREDALRDEKIVALGTLAAGVAHEINTPLATMSLIAEELGDIDPADPEFEDRINDLKRQIGLCKSRLSTLVDSVESSGKTTQKEISLKVFLKQIFDSWQIVRPEIDLQITYEVPFFEGDIIDEKTIAQAIANMLNNAADASIETGSAGVRVTIASTPESIVLTIDDDGPGITLEQLRLAGRAVYSTKDKGMGVGILLSNASVGRFGGDVVLQRRDEGGTRTEIHLPRSALMIQASGAPSFK